MNRFAVIALGLVLLTAGCTAPVVTKAPDLSPGAPLPGWAHVTPVDVPEGLDPSPVLPRRANSCARDAGGLQVYLVGEPEWRVHPLSRDGLWVPSAVLILCIAGSEPDPHANVTLFAADGAGSGGISGIGYPSLEPGESVGPIRVYANRGLPPSVTRLWLEDGSLWPDWRLTVRHGETPLMEARVRRILGSHPAANEAPGGAAKGDGPLTLDLLKRSAFSRGVIHQAGQPDVELFLYAPDAHFTVETSLWCGAPRGATNAEGAHWEIWVGGEGATPTRLADVGARFFPGHRWMKVQPVPDLQTTFLLLEQYGSCANSTWVELWAYDHTTGSVYRPQQETDNAVLRPASATRPTFLDDGTLTSHSYSNADELGWHVRTYRWDAGARIWRLVSHTIEK